MSISTPGTIERTFPRPSRLRDLTDKTVRDEIVSKARNDANASLIRSRRAGSRDTQNKQRSNLSSRELAQRCSS